MGSTTTGRSALSVVCVPASFGNTWLERDSNRSFAVCISATPSRALAPTTRLRRLESGPSRAEDIRASTYNDPPHFIFGEGVLPSSSRRNLTRTYMPDKPHQGGTKMSTWFAMQRLPTVTGKYAVVIAEVSTWRSLTLSRASCTFELYLGYK